MAKSEKRISISVRIRLLRSILKIPPQNSGTVLKIQIKKTLSFTEMMEFVNVIVLSCFQEDGRVRSRSYGLCYQEQHPF